MKLFLRLAVLLGQLYFSRKQPKLPFDTESSMTFRVLPTDLDLNFHVNNGRYLMFMDLGRIALMGEVGLLGPLLRKRWYPVLGSAHIHFRRSLQLNDRFELKTKVVHWDEKWVFLEQRFERGGELIALAKVKSLLRHKNQNVAPVAMFEVLGVSPPHPNCPEDIAHLEKLDAII